jgi:hypothetical protein
VPASPPGGTTCTPSGGGRLDRLHCVSRDCRILLRIFEKLGWSRQEQLRFDDFKDPVTGEKYIPSDIHGNHTEMVSFAKKIRPIPT